MYFWWMWFGNVVFGLKVLIWFGDNFGGKINFVLILFVKNLFFFKLGWKIVVYCCILKIKLMLKKFCLVEFGVMLKELKFVI